jgi:hypothetical protein
MSDYSDEEIIRIENGNSKKRNISIKNIEPVKGINIVREYSDSDSSEASSIISEKPKKTKKVLRRREIPQESYYGKPDEVNYSNFSNPKKVRQQEEYSEKSSLYETESESGNGVDEETFQEEPKPKQTWEDKQRAKQDLLIKIQALEKKGFEFSKKFTMTSNFEEMMFEYEKIKKFIETQAAIKFSRRCLMACVTGLEFLNKRFDPFHIKLEGWSENVMENVDDYDNIFERLHEKYGGKKEVAPEIELLLTLGGSAFMFHLTNTLLKGPAMGNLVGQNSPNFMANMMGAMSQGMKEMNKPPTGQGMANMFQQQKGFPKPVDTRTTKQEMTGPTIDSNLFNGTPLASNHPSLPTFQKPQPMPREPPIQQQQAPKPFYDNSPIDDDDRFSVASSDSSLSSVSTRNVTVKKRPTKVGKSGGGLELNII